MAPSKKGNKSKQSRSKSTTKTKHDNDNLILADYTVITTISKQSKKEINYLEVDGIILKNRSTAKGISYWECQSHQNKNSPDCFFRGKISNFDPSIKEGQIEIIKNHSDTCKFLPNNKTIDYSKNKEIKQRTKLYKEMKLEVEKKLDQENWLSIHETYKWIIENFEISKHLSYEQVNDIVKEWRKQNDVSKDSYILAHQMNKKNLPFFRGILTQNFKKNGHLVTGKIVLWCSEFKLTD